MEEVRCIRREEICVYSKKRVNTVQVQPQTSTEADSASSVVVARESSASFATTSTSPPSHVSYASSIKSPKGAETQAYSHENVSPADTPSTDARSPILLSVLISQDIYLCTTIDLLAARAGQPSFDFFKKQVEHPFITPYDPVNWIMFKDEVIERVSHSTPVATAALAVQECYQARRLPLPLANAVLSFNTANDIFNTVLAGEGVRDHLDTLLTTAHLLVLFHMLAPLETKISFLGDDDSQLIRLLSGWRFPGQARSALSLRLVSWMLVCHAAARRSGNAGLLSPANFDLLKDVESFDSPAMHLTEQHTSYVELSLLNLLSIPLWSFYFQLQLLSAQIADLSHYHRRRTTGADQEEVALLMAGLRGNIIALWETRPPLLDHTPDDLRKSMPRPAVSEPLELLSTFCRLTYHTELVELGRNLSAEQEPSAEARLHLAQMRRIFNTAHCETAAHPAMLRPLFLYAIESAEKADSDWAVACIRRIKDPTSYSEFFASFAEGLSEKQRQKAAQGDDEMVLLAIVRHRSPVSFISTATRRGF